MTRIRATRVRALLLATTLVLAACSGSGDADEATDATPVPPPAATSGTDEPTTTAADDAGTTTPAPASTSPTTASPGTTSPATTVPASTTTASDATSTVATVPFEPVGAGPYDVGVATIGIDDPERPLTVDVWFPLGPGSADDLPPQRYTLLPGVFYESPRALAADADAMATDGPFPLVVYSHGSGGLRYLHSAYTEVLASHGHVVAAPDHTGNTVIDRFTGTSDDRDAIVAARPVDLSRVIDALVDSTHPTAGPYAAQVDPERIAVTGHSVGGLTSVTMVTGFPGEVADVPADPRVDAIVPLAPATGPAFVPDEVLDDVDVPMMILAGTNDVTTPVDPNVDRLWDLNDNSPAYRVELVDGAHQTFTDLCAYGEFLPTLGDDVPAIVVETIEDFGTEGCSPDDVDDERAHDLTNTYVLAFLDQVFRDGDPIAFDPPDDVVVRAR